MPTHGQYRNSWEDSLVFPIETRTTMSNTPRALRQHGLSAPQHSTSTEYGSAWSRLCRLYSKDHMRHTTITPWGIADTVKDKAGDGTVLVVTTSGHGGIGIHAARAMPAYFRSKALVAGDWLWYEEDLDWAMAALSFPDLFPEDQESAKSTLLNFHPNEYEKHYGHRPTAAESIVVAERERNERLKDKFTVSSGFGDWAWDVPAGFVYASGRRMSDGATEGFLVPKDQYVNVHELVLDDFQKWKPDMTLPYSKPKVEAATA